jgi:hypothetical protein
MLILAGVNDTQVLLDDIKMLMDAGDVPKDFWINPRGGHLGREVKGWTDANIFGKSNHTLGITFIRAIGLEKTIGVLK